MYRDGTVRILSIDGGGMRARMASEYAKRFCEDADIDGNKLYESFDIITGTSAGGISALAYSFGLSPVQMCTLLEEKGGYIFNPGLFTLPYYKERVVMGLSTSSYMYDYSKILDVVNDIIPGTTKLSDLPGKVIIPAWNRATNLPTLFSNFVGYEYLTGRNELVNTVAAATSCAPVYFQEIPFSGGVYADGGVIQNNPTLIAYHVAQSVFPTAKRYCILSLGSGATYADVLQPSIPPDSLLLANNNASSQERAEITEEFNAFKTQIRLKYPHLQLDGLSSDLFGSILVPDRVQDLFYYLQNVFIGGVQQLVDDLMQFASRDPYKSMFYLRLQYNFTQGQDSALDETYPYYMAQLVQYANDVYDDNALKISNFINHFNV